MPSVLRAEGACGLLQGRSQFLCDTQSGLGETSQGGGGAARFHHCAWGPQAVLVCAEAPAAHRVCPTFRTSANSLPSPCLIPHPPCHLGPC